MLSKILTYSFLSLQLLKINEAIMAGYNNNVIQKYSHLKYYPKINIDDKGLNFFKKLNISKDLSIDYFIDRLNFFLSLTSKNLTFGMLNNKKDIILLMDNFYSFMFSKDNLFNYSKTNQGRYNKIFTSIEKSLSINLSRECNFDYTKLPKERLEYFQGWYIVEGKKCLFVNFVNFYEAFGQELTNEYFDKIKVFILNKNLKSFAGSLLTIFLNYLASKKELSFSTQELITIMKDFFIGHQEKNNDINTVKSEWNYFVLLVNYLFPLESHEKYILPKKSSYDSHIKTKNGKQYKTKLITEIPLEIYDNQAFDILFKKINQDIQLVEQWADYTINYHYQSFLNVKEDFKVKSDYYNLGIKEIAMLKFGKYDRINKSHVYNSDSYFNRNILFAIAVKLILNHPEITDSFISNCVYCDDKENIIGINSTDQGKYLIGYKLRKGQSLAEQKILLNKESSKAISILLEMTNDIRENLKEKNNNLYKNLFISACVNNLIVTEFSQPSFAINKEPFNHIINYLQKEQNISYEDSINFAKSVSLTKIRASRGVQVYFETQSTTQMAKALGHTKYDPQLLSRYLPAPILDFFQRRWILLFQKGIICEAMKDSEFLLKASNFKSMEQLNTFLENHTLKNIPNMSNKKKDNTKENDSLKVYISVDEEKIAALLSIGKAVENAKDLNKVSSKAIYWKQLGEQIVKEINNNHSYAQYKHIVANAKNKIQANLFDKVIYE
jgi:hypothetical protein